MRLAIDSIDRVGRIATDNLLSGLTVSPFKEDEVILERKFSPKPFFWRNSRKWQLEFFSSDEGRELIEKGDFFISDDELLS